MEVWDEECVETIVKMKQMRIHFDAPLVDEDALRLRNAAWNHFGFERDAKRVIVDDAVCPRLPRLAVARDERRNARFFHKQLLDVHPHRLVLVRVLARVEILRIWLLCGKSCGERVADKSRFLGAIIMLK